MRYRVRKLKPHLEKYLVKRGLVKKWDKAIFSLEDNLSYPSLNFEKIILKKTVFYSFRLDSKYRGVCVLDRDEIEIVAFTNHYEK